MQNDKLLNSSGVNSTDDIFSATLKEFSSLKAEVLVLQKIPSHQTTTSHFTYPSHNRSHFKSFNQNSQNHPELHPNYCHFHPIQQSGVIELTLHFQEFPNKQFIHSFIVANIKHAILGLDFLKLCNFIIETASTVDILNSTKENIFTPLPCIYYNIHSYENTPNMFPNLESGQPNGKKQNTLLNMY